MTTSGSHSSAGIAISGLIRVMLFATQEKERSGGRS